VIASAMHAMIASRENPSGKTLRRCMFMIDEFGSIGHIPDVASQLAQMRGYGMDFTLVLQGLNQLKEHYGDAKDSILGNCRYKYFCDVNDLESAKWLSETLGKKTVETLTKSESQGSSKGGQTEGTSTTLGETGRALLTPDEIMLLGRDTAILLNPDTRPHYLHTVDYRKLTQAYQHLSHTHPNLYWQPALTYDQNPHYNASSGISSGQDMFDEIAAKYFKGKKLGK
jgi:type IV secretory pathway TraG/TraD family ATPase VirD4